MKRIRRRGCGHVGNRNGATLELPLPAPTSRRRLGRPRGRSDHYVPHLPRARVSRHHGVHVTLRLVDGLPSLRRPTLADLLSRVFSAECVDPQAPPVTKPRSWLIRTGWRRYGLIHTTEYSPPQALALAGLVGCSDSEPDPAVGGSGTTTTSSAGGSGGGTSSGAP